MSDQIMEEMVRQIMEQNHSLQAQVEILQQQLSLAWCEEPVNAVPSSRVQNESSAQLPRLEPNVLLPDVFTGD